MNIPLVPPPSNADHELQRWLNDLIQQVSGAFENQEAEITALKKEVAALKGTP